MIRKLMRKPRRESSIMASCDQNNGDYDETNIPTSSSSSSYRNQAPTLSENDIEAAKAREKSPIGLKLTRTPSFQKEFMSVQPQLEDHSVSKPSSSSSDSRKAVSFPALSLQIGTWKRKAKHEGEVVTKCFFKKEKLAWEVLFGNQKKKIEFDWSNIFAIKATFLETKGVLEVKLNNPPKFFQESNPEPKKHANWISTGTIQDDFTVGKQGSLISKHTLEFAPEILKKYYKQVICREPKLRELSKLPFPTGNNMNFRVISFSNVELPPHNSANHHSGNEHLLAQETKGLNQHDFESQTFNPRGLEYLRSDQSQFMDMRNNHMMIEPQTRCNDAGFEMYVDNSTSLSTLSGTSPIQHDDDYSRVINGHCYYDNDQSQFISYTSANQGLVTGYTSLEPRSLGLEAMDFSDYVEHTSLSNFTARGSYDTRDDDQGDVFQHNENAFSSENNVDVTSNVAGFTRLQLLENYPLQWDNLPTTTCIEENNPQSSYYNYDNNWGVSDHHQPSCDYYQSQQFYNT